MQGHALRAVLFQQSGAFQRLPVFLACVRPLFPVCHSFQNAGGEGFQFLCCHLHASFCSSCLTSFASAMPYAISLRRCICAGVNFSVFLFRLSMTCFSFSDIVFHPLFLVSPLSLS
uniref:Uncharacterized protein n=1 Tax=Siphoviridae sp. cttpk5 TaxID=2826496 RepID=A0A8S5NJC7_9CAUD|nr:MAG TPA: hypothetical protein [Siphoviridae sp. cttpk5]